MNFDRLYSLIKERGYNRSYVCKQMGKATNYLSDCKSGKNKLTDESIDQISKILNTTPDYLLGKTDKKEKPAKPGELSESKKEFLELVEQIPPEKWDEFMRMVGIAVKGLLASD